MDISFDSQFEKSDCIKFYPYVGCTEYAFEKLNAKNVYTIIPDINISSQNAAKRAGMKKTDTVMSLRRASVGVDKKSG